MNLTTALIVATTSLVGGSAALWLAVSAWPVYHAAVGQSRKLMGSVIALAAAIGMGDVFWIILILIPADIRAQGGPAFWPVLMWFVFVQLMPAAVAVYLWKTLIGPDRNGAQKD